MIRMKCNTCDGALENELDVRFGTDCDNHCPFCITRNCGKQPYKMNVDKLISATFESGHRTCINIVGGEPLLPSKYEQLLKYLKAIRNNTDSIAIITSLPKIPKEKYELFSEIMEYVDDLVVSVQHYDAGINNFLMRASSHHNRMKMLENLAKNERYSAKLSVTMNVSRSGISTEADVVAALKYFESLNIKYVRINELMDEYEHISSREIFPKMKIKSPYAHGCSTDVTKYFKKKYGINIKTIKLKTRCFLVEPAEKASLADLIKIIIKRISFAIHKEKCKYIRRRDTVLYEDGHLELKY